jgi:hypothetical protein
MSLVYTVVSLMQSARSATVDDLLPMLPDYSREQVIKAMQNARQAGWLSCDGHQPRRADSPSKRATGVGRGSVPATYHFVQMPTFKPRAPKGSGKKRARKPNYARRYTRRPMVASIFDLADYIGKRERDGSQYILPIHDERRERELEAA